MGSEMCIRDRYTLGGARLESSSVANLDVYPNPSRNVFNVTFTSEEVQSITIKVINMLVVEVFSQQYSNVSTQFLEQIDLSNYSKGIYSLEIRANSGTLYRKIALQ